MIRRLHIQNLVLVDACEVGFDPQFNTITGETGSGKTALMEALRLCLGQRADSDTIRKGCDKASVELVVSLAQLPQLKPLLESAGLETEEEELLIRRELSIEGKNRLFINCRSAPLPLLQQIGSFLVDMVGQSSSQGLRSSEAQRELIDRFGQLEPLLAEFQASYRAELALEQQLGLLGLEAKQQHKEEEICRFQLEELKEVQFKEGEEEELFARYESASSSKQISESLEQMIQLLSSRALPSLQQLTRLNDSLVGYGQNFVEVATLLKEGSVSLKEALCVLEKEQSKEPPSAQLLAHLEEKLSTWNRLKRKYGMTLEQLQAHKTHLAQRLDHLGSLSIQIEELTLRKEEQHGLTENKARALSESRKKVATEFSARLTQEIQELNMNGASVEIRLIPQARSQQGDEGIEFWLQANPGERPSLVKETASGGEVSRLLFAIKMVLAEKNHTPTLIFDEIDANVGGKTATLIGKKLKELARHKQVICITHFPQVASQADTHFQVDKVQQQGRSYTTIRCLSQEETEQELARMRGQ